MLEARYFEVYVGEAVVRDTIGVAYRAKAHPGSVERHIQSAVFTVEGPITVPPTASSSWPSLCLRSAGFGQFTFLFLLLAFIVREHADNGKGLAVEVDGFTKRNDFASRFLGRTKEFVTNSGSDDANGV